MTKNLSQIPSSELSRFACERLEPKPTTKPVITGRIGLTTMTDIPAVTIAWRYSFRREISSDVSEWQPRNCETEAEMTLMMLERMREPELWLESNPDDGPHKLWGCCADMNGERNTAFADTVRLAVLRAFCLAEGFGQ